MNHIVMIIMDSCRYDTFCRAKTPHMSSIGKVQRRYSYASWTAPSHYVLLMGLLPHENLRNVLASEVYKKEFTRWAERIGISKLEFKHFLPELSLPKVLKTLGYRTIARVSLPVLNESTLLSAYFDEYKLMKLNSFADMVDEIDFPVYYPVFYFLNLGETHYPYMLEGLPHLSGLHGILKKISSNEDFGNNTNFFDEKMCQRLYHQQIRCVEYLDEHFGRLLEKAPSNTYFIITSDHGELFGEDGFFGHGPIMHEKCFEVPLIEGKHPGG